MHPGKKMTAEAIAAKLYIWRAKSTQASVWDNVLYIAIMRCSIKRLSGIDSWVLSKTV